MNRQTAVICEFNPIHSGHSFLLSTVKAERSVILAVMSGNFTQRGIPAVFDKYARAQSALACGADLVLELPFPWCVSGAEDFALGGVSVAAGSGAESLTFGSESGDFALLNRAAAAKESEEYTSLMREAEKSGRNRGSAVLFDEVMRTFGVEEPLGANDKLGAEYIRLAKRLDMARIEPVTRMKDAPSASGLRKLLYTEGFDALKPYLPREAFAVLQDRSICPEEKYAELLFAHCRLYIPEDEPNDLLRYAAKAARECVTAAEFLEKLPTKKYTAARMRREILRHLLSVTPEESRIPPRFTVLLAANEAGRAYLSERGKTFGIPIITKPADFSGLDEVGKTQYSRHRSADSLYALLTGRPADYFLKQHPVIR